MDRTLKCMKTASVNFSPHVSHRPHNKKVNRQVHINFLHIDCIVSLLLSLFCTVETEDVSLTPNRITFSHYAKEAVSR